MELLVKAKSLIVKRVASSSPIYGPESTRRFAELLGLRKIGQVLPAIQSAASKRLTTTGLNPITTSGRSRSNLALRPIYHQLEHRIEAHIFVAFLAYCLHATLRHRLRQSAPGLTPRAVLEKLAAIQMLDVHFPTTDGRWLTFVRYTQP